MIDDCVLVKQKFLSQQIILVDLNFNNVVLKCSTFKRITLQFAKGCEIINVKLLTSYSNMDVSASAGW